MNVAFLLAICTVSVLADIRFPSDFSADVQSNLASLVPASADITLEVDVRVSDEETFEVQCMYNSIVIRGSCRRGLLLGFFSLLRNAGYGFLHPVHTIVPSSNLSFCRNFSGVPDNSGRGGTPLLGAVRGSHIHTQHPLELTNLLNGFDSEGGHESHTSWSAGLPLWTSYLRWLVANGQNFVEWCLLEARSWADFSTSSSRHERSRTLVDMAHEWGVRVAIDAPLNLAQQHAWRLQPTEKSNATERLNWLIELGVDAVSTEVGTTEFTSTSPKATLSLLDTLIETLASQGKELIVKNHASTSQVAKGLQDPLHPDRDINFNFITYYADKRVVNAPHTVQMYALTDPLVGSYGRTNYTDIYNMMRLFEQENRSAIYFPETAYWVDFDTSVPLFLPLYAADRFADLQRLRHEMPSIGHLNFESGWPLGSWFNNAAQAAAAWSVEQAPDFVSFTAQILAPLPHAQSLVQIVATLANIQNASLVFDRFVGKDGKTQTLLAYVQGDDGMNEAQDAWNIAVVQPKRTHPRDLDPSWFESTLQPRFAALEASVRPLEEQCRAIRMRLQTNASQDVLARDLCIGVELFSLRVRQAHAVYRAAAARARHSDPGEGLAQSHSAMIDATELLEQAQLDDAMTKWTGHAVPTAYPFGYLWPAKNLFYWRRDHQIVEHGIFDPCYLNLYDPIEVGMADGGEWLWKIIAKYGKDALRWFPWLRKWAGCMSGPRTQPPPLDPLYVNVTRSVQLFV
eukprot:TRINITY_DN71748_c0_g1_i1.p1 TRINITY_DN71748_c0_g1~~TRINITY_DN71748_c0_g1_i1.p1  ORF type:complete len:740 (-),score=64.21 TRINITY_DN71748_c0_g1_i1:162-2381(-)